MKQIETMFQRFLDAKKPLTAKWQMRLVAMNRRTSYDDSEINMQCIIFMHYHHNILVWDIDNDKTIYSFSEKAADERGLRAIYKYLGDPENKKRVIEAARTDEAAFKMQYDLDYIYLQGKKN